MLNFTQDKQKHSIALHLAILLPNRMVLGRRWQTDELVRTNKLRENRKIQGDLTCHFELPD